MTPEPAEVDRRIGELSAAVDGLPTGGPERLAARVELAKLLFTRYVRDGGSDRDRLLAEEICREVLADPGATPDERQAMALAQSVLTMIAATPAHLFRGKDFRIGDDALRLTEQWQRAVDPATTAVQMQELAAQLAAVPIMDGLPPQLRSVLGLVGGMADLLGASRQPGWDGRLDPALEVRLRELMSEAPARVPGLETVRALVAWLGGSAPTGGADSVTGGRVAELQSALAGLPADHLLAPVLRLDLAQAIIGRPELAGPDALRRAIDLIERARAGIGEDHPLHEETLRALTGALLAAAAHDPSEAHLGRAERIAGQLLARPRDSGPADRGAELFLQAMLDLLRSRLTGDRAAADAIRGLVDALEVLPVNHALRPVVVGQAAAVLADRYLVEGRLEDIETADRILDDLARAVQVRADDGSSAFLACVVALCRIIRAVRLDDVPATDEAAAALRAGLAHLPGHYLMRPNFELVAAIAELKSASVGGDRAPLWNAVRAARRVLDGNVLAGVAPGAAATLAGALDVVRGQLDADPSTIAESIARMEAELGAAIAVPEQRVGQRALLGEAYLAALGVGVAADVAADKAVVHLSEALRLLGERRPGVQRHDILRHLARAHRARGDRELSRVAGFRAMEALAGVVLLQSGVGHAVLTARGASAEAFELARWCLADGELGRAAQAVEMGRGLALHAAATALRVPDLLRGAGWRDLAEAWERDAGQPPATGRSVVEHLRAAGDLRHRVLDVLRTTTEGARLFRPPQPAEVGDALRGVGADVLVYLVPGDRASPGHLLLIGLDGEPTALEASRLRVEPDGPLTDFLRLSSFDAAAGGTASGQERRAALTNLCDWAGQAVLEPLRAAIDQVRAPDSATPLRVVLVPGGVLGAVPWSAARTPDGSGGVRYACQDLVLSIAASARQLVDVAARDASRPGGPPVLVGNADSRLTGAAAEVRALRDTFYPTAIVLGLPDGPEAEGRATAGRGTPDEVLAQLPSADSTGAPLLHLACHAATAATAEASRIELTEPLPIRRIMEHATGRAAGAAGPTVVLSACRTDLTEQDYDEALTLATAFLAAGAVTVVGSRWEVLDRLTAILMFALHHFLTAGRQAADALRAAQLWMLDPDRIDLPGMSQDMRRRARRHHLADVSVWAAFSHHGS